MAKILETFSTYVARIEKIQAQMGKSIVLSTKVTIPTLKDGGIKKAPWPLYGMNMLYTVTVPPGTHVRRHSHDEDIFRYVIRGSLTINDSIKVNEGMWVIIKANTPYKIDTENGYKCITGYNRSSVCLSSRRDGKHTIVE
jgi:Cupin domain